jgi:signal peptidase I
VGCTRSVEHPKTWEMDQHVTVRTPPWWLRIIFGRNPRRTLLRLICTAIIILVSFKWILIPIRVSGMSMLPAYRDGKVTFINHLAYAWTKPKRGDVVAFRYPPSGFVFLKRIVGLPGEKVRLEKGRVYINDTLLPEPYTRMVGEAPSFGEIVVKEHEVFVMGDNRGISVFGSIPETAILGRVLY